MRKIPSVFKRDHDGTGQLTEEVTPGCEWVLAGEGVATVKWDGTACMVRDGQLFRRYDRKVTKAAKRRGAPYTEADCKPAPDGWEACEETVNEHTGHWPGWVPVGEGPEVKRHLEAFALSDFPDGTYELVGPKVNGNPDGFLVHLLVPHGVDELPQAAGLPRSFETIRGDVGGLPREGIVFHHPDGRLAKAKRRDFGLPWPLETGR